MRKLIIVIAIILSFWYVLNEWAEQLEHKNFLEGYYVGWDVGNLAKVTRRSCQQYLIPQGEIEEERR